ncbi:hypothetical protein SDC9_159528 [bioreactor metagenome]|uniref:Uncharacterized protein n=1 Tax=bioreactor metagenome TaxID=1076179 RepID=A0A645FF46_9ZZZZ
MTRIGVQAQVHGKLIGAQIGAISHHNISADFRVSFHPGLQTGIQSGMNGIFLKNGYFVKKRQGAEFWHRFTFFSAADAMRWKLRKFHRICFVGILGEHNIAQPQLPGRFKQAADRSDDLFNPRAGKRAFVAETVDHIHTDNSAFLRLSQNIR